MSEHWEELDVAALLARRAQQEDTVAANVGPYIRPLGPLMRPPNVTGAETPWEGLPPEYVAMLGRDPRQK